MFLIPASSLQLIWSPTDLASCFHPGYIIIRHPPSSCGCHKSHSIQPVHGQGYILIFLDRTHLLFTQVHFLFWQLGRSQYVTIKVMEHESDRDNSCSCGKFSDEAWSFLLFRIYGRLTTSLLLYSHRFSRWPSSGICRTMESTQNFKLRLLFNPYGSLFLIPLTITGYKCYYPAVRIELTTFRWVSL